MMPVSNHAPSEPRSDRSSSAAANHEVDLPFLRLYTDKPTQDISLFELERLIVRRMHILSTIASVHQKSDNLEQVKTSLLAKLDNERPLLSYVEGTILLSDSPVEFNDSISAPKSEAPLTPQSDLLSHLACRLVFCQNEAWRDWFVRHEEMLFTIRLERLLEIRGNAPLVLKNAFRAADIKVKDVVESKLAIPDSVSSWLLGTNNTATTLSEYYVVPIASVQALVKSRGVVCLKGKALVHQSDMRAVLLTAYRAAIKRGLSQALILRQKTLGSDDSGALHGVLDMLDAFFKRYIVDPSDDLAPSKEGSVTFSDIPRLASRHFPLCMKRIDDHVRTEGHMKHNTRWQYGLFLKAIGLSLDDAMKLFASVMTLKGGSSVEQYQKSSYGYNIRHMYGKEGKHTSYSSMSCGSIIKTATGHDKHDCHGCPFNLSVFDEAKLRTLLQQERGSPVGTGNVRCSPQDIEDIVEDAKAHHYTRACFRYFTSMHQHAVLRDTLFRSPFEYFITSTSAAPSTSATDVGQDAATATIGGAAVGTKRPPTTTEPFDRDPRQ